MALRTGGHHRWVLTATCVWVATPELIVAIDGRFGEPVDAYVNGSQVWLREDGPSGIVLEWRLHPVGGYVRPAGASTELSPWSAGPSSRAAPEAQASLDRAD